MLNRLLKRFRSRRASSASERVFNAVSALRAPVVFVQVGSNDADHGDPIRQFVRDEGWKGKMIEPVPYVYSRLVEKWKDFPRIELINCAIDERPGWRDFFYLEQSDDPLPQWYDQLGSFHLENILKHRSYIPDIDRRVRSMKVECRSVREIMSDEVSVFHCDVEGHDHRIVGALLDSEFRPPVILFEHIHVPAVEARLLSERLEACGYVHAVDGQNTLAVLRSERSLSRLIGGRSSFLGVGEG